MLKITWEGLFNDTAEEALARIHDEHEFLIGTLQDLGCEIIAENVQADSKLKETYDEWNDELISYELHFFNITMEFSVENERKLDNFIQLILNMDYDIKVER